MASAVRLAGGDVVPLPRVGCEPQLLLALADSLDLTSLDPIRMMPAGTEALEQAEGTAVEASASGVACPVETLLRRFAADGNDAAVEVMSPDNRRCC